MVERCFTVDNNAMRPSDCICVPVFCTSGNLRHSDCTIARIVVAMDKYAAAAAAAALLLLLLLLPGTCTL
jgi:hypothetical protein